MKLVAQSGAGWMFLGFFRHTVPFRAQAILVIVHLLPEKQFSLHIVLVTGLGWARSRHMVSPVHMRT